MKLNCSQAGEKLGITSGAVRDIIAAGKLTDHSVRKNGAKHHFAKVDSRELNAFKKIYKKKTHIKNYPPASELLKKAVKPAKPAARTPKTVKEPQAQHTPLNGLFTRITKIEERLSSIEDKLDRITRLWE